MGNAFDDRLITLTISLDGKTIATYDQSFYIIATGMAYTNGNFGECALRIDNISQKVRDQLVTATSQWNNLKRAPAFITLSVGRESYGTFQIFSGNAIASNPSQPPDIGLTIRSLTQASLLGYPNAFAAPAMSSVKSICQNVAQSSGLALDFQAKNNPNIGNYHFTGAVGKQLQKLQDLGVSAYVDQGSNTLVVTDYLSPREGGTIQVNSETGMIGVPEVTEVGVRVKMLITNQIKIGSQVQVTSKINPAANGIYILNKLGFEIASRDTPFYWILDTVYGSLGAQTP